MATVIVLPFPPPPVPVLVALELLQDVRRHHAGRPARAGVAEMERPWEPAACSSELSAAVWSRCDDVAVWINHEYAWRPAQMEEGVAAGSAGQLPLRQQWAGLVALAGLPRGSRSPTAAGWPAQAVCRGQTQCSMMSLPGQTPRVSQEERVPDVERLYSRLFAALPTPHVAVTLDMVVVDASDTYLDLFNLRRAEVIGRPIISLFPPDPASLDVDGTPFILQSFFRAAETRRPDPMPVARYDIVDHTGEIAERYWSHIAFPVVDEDADEVVLVVQVLTEVTEYVKREQQTAPAEGSWRSRAEAVEALLLARVGEIRDARAAERQALAMRAALAETGLGMAGAATVAELDRVVIERGRATVGAVVGSVGVRDGELLRQTITAELTPTFTRYSTIPLDSSLHVAVVSREGHPVLLPDVAASVDFSTEMADVVATSDLQAFVGFPYRVEGRLRGAITFAWDHPRPFTDPDVDVLSALAAQYGQAVARIEARAAEQVRTNQAVQMSEALQRSLLSEPQARPGFTVTARYRPAAQLAQIGGDWFDSFTTADDDQLHIVVGDVSGHDQHAAALMGQARNVLRGIASTVTTSPADVVRRLDQTLEGLGAHVYATMIMATLTRSAEDGAVLQWTNAGHPAPLLLRADGTVDVLDTRPEPMLGADPTRARSDHTARLAPEETLLLYTDGLIERRRADLDAGQDWLIRTVREHLRGGGSPDALCEHLVDVVAGHAEDDIVVLTLTANTEGQIEGR